ncbi:HNH endonuclease signature motif containing protein [Allokutzneria sp. NRRL B-24872]|uniref:HNH endonuclease signature motif containing protein n=1 Tax=Allokutzneria sp. NRRL B-24872 TaxID=1137961 RepID=UPI000A35D929|nr:HNH endonuclease signature motif containing protein [Allokutzneria sp. NRRL B-24872]
MDEADVKAAYAAIAEAVATFSVTLVDYLAELDSRDREFADNFIAPVLKVSPIKAGRLIDSAVELVERHVVFEAMAEGRIDQGKSLMILDLLRALPVTQALIVEEALVTHAATNTYSATRQYGVRFIHRLDPKAAERRHAEKHKARLVEKFNLEDGMSSLRLTMTAHDAALSYDRVDHIAKALPKDHRTLDQKRSDVARDLLHGKETAAPQGQTVVYLTMPVTSALGLTDDPGILTDDGPLPAPLARDIAAGGIWKRILTDPVTGMAEEISDVYRPNAKQRELIAARYPTCTAIGCRQPAHRCDYDHCRPYNGSNTTITNLRPKCRRHHRMKTHTNWQCANGEDGVHTWTTPRGHTYETAPEPIAEPAPF